MARGAAPEVDTAVVAALAAADERGLSAVELAVTLDCPVRAVRAALTRGSTGPRPELGRYSPRGRWLLLPSGQPGQVNDHPVNSPMAATST